MKLHAWVAVIGLSATMAFGGDYMPKTLELGSQAPDFDLPGVDGRNWALKDFANAKVLVVVFTAVHCPTGELTACI